MNPQQTSEPLARVVSREFLALMKHCLTCPECLADTSKACPEAARLRSIWSKAWRKATS